jgi:hypothetical protein
MRFIRTSLSLAALAMVAGCQTWSTVALTVSVADASTIRNAVTRATFAEGFRPCSEWRVSVADADLCLGGRIDGTAVTIAGFASATSYTVKIGFYAAGLGNEEVRKRIEGQCKEALEAGAPGANVSRSELREMLHVRSLDAPRESQLSSSAPSPTDGKPKVDIERQ